MTGGQVLITGCSRGLGLELTTEALRRGNLVTGISRKFPPREVNENMRFRQITCDLLSPTETDLCLKSLAQPFQLVIHNAGLGHGGLAFNLNTQAEDFRKMWRLNFEATVQLSRFFVRQAIAKRQPIHQIYVSSMTTHVSFRGLAGYAATKAASEAYLRHQALELKNDNCSFSIVCPDYFESQMTESIADSTRQEIEKTSPLTPAELALKIFDLSDGPPEFGRAPTYIISHRKERMRFEDSAIWV